MEVEKGGQFFKLLDCSQACQTKFTVLSSKKIKKTVFEKN